jgi:uncharacterized protein (DUF2147 family)
MMKKILFIILLCPFIALAQKNADDLLGKFMTSKNDAIIEIYKEGNVYNGKIIWNKTEGLKDTKNPDLARRNDPIKGLVILKNFRYLDGQWKTGTIYDPKNGKTYDCKISIDERKNLNVRGFIGVSLLGRTEYFVRVNN